MKNKSLGKVVLGMSGGVDSSLAAFLLKEKGYDVIPIFLQNYPDESPYLDSICPFKEDKNIAEKICKSLGLKLKKIDYRTKYLNEVIEPMFSQYEKNLTPNPDVSCNTIIKFPALWKYAKSISADYIATGHYARISKDKNGFHLLQGIDKNKDQSYFLHELSQSDLSHTLFPIGNLTKTQVRNLAKKVGFKNWDKQSSRGICFIGKTNFKEFLKKKISPKPGPVLSISGEIIGKHPGMMYFTNGERVRPGKGFEIDSKYINRIGNKKIYVFKKIKPNKIIIAPENHPSLKRSKINLKK
ncbi:MAG: tRNA 2-thiouridine(34) synthase MnmA, partial [Nanoarchaeota archaeon]|nr:tRNA 2-thiouridine(34) synthase MnmA [Nanoarchaeota archaeon]